MKPFFKPILAPRILYDEGGVVVVAKPSGMHCAPAGETGTLCSWLFQLRPEIALVRGRSIKNGCGTDEGGLLHRLDAATSGLVAFATNDTSFEQLLIASKSGTFIKSYHALALPTVSGLLGSKPDFLVPPGVNNDLWISCLRREDTKRIAELISNRIIVSRFRPFGPGSTRVACATTSLVGTCDSAGIPSSKKGKSWTHDSYQTEILAARQLADGVILEVTLSRGFRHQVRAHLAWIGLPLEGDPIYGEVNSSDGHGAGELRLRAFRLTFPSPAGTGNVVVNLDEPEHNTC